MYFHHFSTILLIGTFHSRRTHSIAFALELGTFAQIKNLHTHFPDSDAKDQRMRAY